MLQAHDDLVTNWICPLSIQRHSTRNRQEDDVSAAFLSEQTDGAICGEGDEEVNAKAVGAYRASDAVRLPLGFANCLSQF